MFIDYHMRYTISIHEEYFLQIFVYNTCTVSPNTHTNLHPIPLVYHYYISTNTKIGLPLKFFYASHNSFNTQ